MRERERERVAESLATSLMENCAIKPSSTNIGPEEGKLVSLRPTLLPRSKFLVVSNLQLLKHQPIQKEIEGRPKALFFKRLNYQLENCGFP